MCWRSLIRDSHFRFCDDGSGLQSQIVSMLNEQLYSNAIGTELAERYERMCLNFRDCAYNSDEWRQSTGNLTNDTVSEYDKEAAVLDVPFSHFVPNSPIDRLTRDYYNCGTDLPVWFDSGQSDLKVMLVGQDPLRNNHPKKGHLFLSSPWGLHCSAFPKCGRTRNAISRFVRMGVQVYVTDFAKLYFSRDSRNEDPRKSEPSFKRRLREVAVRWQSQELNQSILRKEREIFCPNITIFLGKGCAEQAGLQWRDDDYASRPYANTMYGPTVVLKHPNTCGITNEYFDVAFRTIIDRL